MKKLSTAIVAGSLWLAGTTFGQAPAAAPANTNTACPCDKNGDGKCDRCGRAAGQGRGQGRGPGRSGMMAMRGGGMGRGNGACMRMMGQGAATQQESTPKTDKK
jgi:hypothetical protein